MKNRKKFTVSDADHNSLDTRIKKKISSNPLLQKNLGFLQNYNNLFRRPTVQFGDADTYFKRTLRVHEEFDLIRELQQNNLIKTAKSAEFINRNKLRSKLAELRASTEVKLPLLHKVEPIPEVDFESDENLDTFYSPNSELTNREAEETSEEVESQKLAKESEDKEEKLSNFEENLTLDKREKMAEEFDDLPEMDEEELGATVADEPPSEAEVTEGGEETEDEEIKEVQKIIKEASDELDQVAEENQELLGSIKKDATEAPPAAEDQGDGSFFKFDPAINAQLLAELDDVERSAKETGKIILHLKTRVTELTKIAKMTEVEARELEQINKELKAQMLIFEEKTKRLQFLITQANLFEKMILPKPALQKKYQEDRLPKVIVCGLTENYIPNIIVCDDFNQARKISKDCPGTTDKPCPFPDNPCPKMADRPRPRPNALPTCTRADVNCPGGNMPQFARKLNDSYCMQEKLAAENADLEGMRYQLQSDLINKDQTVESLQRQLAGMQAQMRMMCNENSLLNEKLQGNQQQLSGGLPPPTQAKDDCTCEDGPYGGQGGGGGGRREQQVPAGCCQSPPSRNMQGDRKPCGKGRGVCPDSLESRLQEYSENTHQLEMQLGAMECDVKGMHQELVAVQKEREHLEHHRKLLCRPPPCPTPCGPPPCPPPCAPPHVCCPPPGVPPDQAKRELQEKYDRLTDDFKSKLVEVAGLRAETENLKKLATEAEAARKILEEKLKDIERELKLCQLNTPKGISKDQMIELEQQLAVAKQRFREAQGELEELRALVEEHQTQLEDYRNKYLIAQQTVEEQRRQIELMDMENQRISEQVNLEIQRVKNQFQEKLQELIPLPDILKSTQIKLQEAQQMHIIAERNNEALVRELEMYKQKLCELNNQIGQVTSGHQLDTDEKTALKNQLDECNRTCQELQDEASDLRNKMNEMQEIQNDNELRLQEKNHEIVQLNSQLENVREESARQVARVKDRCETVRRSMQNQINELERQLAQSRACAKAAQKERDEVRLKMQAQISNLNENFEDAQMRIRNLQGHVNFLKTSANCVFSLPDVNVKQPSLPNDAPCNCGSDY